MAVCGGTAGYQYRVQVASMTDHRDNRRSDSPGSVDMIEGALSAACLDAGVVLPATQWNRLCAAMSKHAKRRGLIS
jgi:hypothetical protein